MLFTYLIKRMIKRNIFYTSISLSIVGVMTGIDINTLSKIIQVSPNILSITIITPAIYALLFSNLTSLLFVDDRRSGLLEYLLSTGYTAKSLFLSYILAYAIITLPVIFIISIIYLLLLKSAYYFAITLLSSLGISLLPVSLSLYITYFQKVSPSGRATSGSFVAIALLIIYILLPTYTTDVKLWTTILSIITFSASLLLINLFAILIKPEKLIA